MNRCKGKLALVTGAASGIGRACAQQLRDEGAKVVLSDINVDAGRATADTMGATFLEHDVASEASWQLVMDSVADHGKLQVLVNNAGIGETSAASNPETTSLDSWQQTFAVNATGVFLGCKYGIPLMRSDCGPGGSIINMSSIAALVATPFITAYGASKAAVYQLTRSVALHCATAGYHLRCNSVHPGQIQTPMLESLFSDAAKAAGVDVETVRNEFRSRVPMGEFGEVSDIANAVVYLASDESKHVTGAKFVIDGGMQLSS